MERVWKITTLKDGGVPPFFLSVRLLHTPTTVGTGSMCFDDSSVFPESELYGSNIPDHPSSLQCRDDRLGV